MAGEEYGTESGQVPRGRLIREMAADDRPREKAMRLGIKSLTDTELMAILFGTGIRGKSVVELSNEILADNEGHLSNIARLSVRDFLRRYKGIGPAKAISLLAALEIGARSAADAAMIQRPVVTGAEVAVSLMRRHLNGLPYEEFWVMLLSQSGKVIREVNISRGGVSATMVDVKVVFKHALENYTSAMILFHNHPSGTLEPSAQDDALTRRIADAAKLLDIRVNDHIIVTDGGYYSYHNEGRIL